MYKRIMLQVLVVLSACLLFMGMKEGANVVAFRHMQQGKFKEALELYIQNNNDSGAGTVYCTLHMYKDALRAFQKANNHSGMGMAYLGQRKFDDAIVEFQKKQDYSGIGLSLLGKRDFKNAINAFTRVNDWSGLGLAYLGQNELEKARSSFKNARDRNGLGMVLVAEGRLDDALGIFKANKNFSSMGMVYLAKRNYKKAQECFLKVNDLSGLALIYNSKREFDNAISLGKEANDLSVLALAYMGKRDFAKALDYAAEANDLSTISLIYTRLNQFDKALLYAEQTNNPTIMGIAHLGNKDYDKAIGLFEKVNDFSGLSLAYAGKRDFSKAMLYAAKSNDVASQGLALLGNRQFKGAISAFTQANDLSGLSLAYTAMHEYDKAIEIAEKANDQVVLAHALCAKLEFDKAIELFKQAGDVSGLSLAYSGKKYFDKAIELVGNSNDFSAIGHAQLGMGKIDEARKSFLKANDLSGLGFVALEKQDVMAAITSFTKANDKSGLGLTYLFMNDFENAQDNFTRTNDTSGLAKIFLKRRQFGEALELFTQLNDYEGIGNTYFGLKEYGLAAKAFEKANNPAKVIQALARKFTYDQKNDVYLTSGFDEALNYGKKQLEIINKIDSNPQEKSSQVLPIYMEMGKVYDDKNDFKSAIEQFTIVQKSDSYLRVDAMYYLGRTYFRMGEYAKAVLTFQDIIKNFPGTKVSADAENSLNALNGLVPMGLKATNQFSLLTDKNRCGPDALFKICLLKGIKSSSEDIAQLAGTDVNGTSAEGISKAARSIGLVAQGVELSFESLKKLNGSAIVVLNDAHYVVVDSIKDNMVNVFDNLEKRVIYKKDFLNAWSNKAIVIVDKESDLAMVQSQRILSGKEMQKIVAGDMRSSGEGGWTKNDPGVYPDGSWMVDYTNMGPIVPVELARITPYLMPNLNAKSGIVPDLTPRISVPSPTTSTRPRMWMGGTKTCEAPVDPISITGGQLILPIRDIEIAAIGKESGLNLRLERTYSSRSTFLGPIGYGWQLYHNVLLTETITEGTSTVEIKGPDGYLFTYKSEMPGSITYTSAASDGSTLLKFPNGYQWKRWTPYYGLQYYFFDVDKKLIRIQGRNYNDKLTYSYNGSLISKITDISGRSLSFTYDANNLMSTVTDPLNRVFKFAYDGNKNLISVTDPLNQITQYEYKDVSDIHNMTAVIDPLGGKTSFIYDATNDSVIKVIDALGKITTYVYDFILGITKVTDPNNNLTTFHFSDAHINKVIDAQGGITTYTYDSRHIRNSITDRNGNTTSWVNDQFLNISSINSALAGTADTMTLTYDPDYHNVTSIVDPMGRQYTFQYDLYSQVGNQGTLLSQTDPLGNVISYTYDNYGQLKTQKDAMGNITSYDYDGYGNLIKVTDPEGFASSYTYDLVGNVLTMKDPLGYVTTFQYDGLNRLIKQTNAINGTATYAYDKNNNIITIVNTKGKSMRYEYDARARLKKIINPLNQAITLTRDNVGNVLSIQYPNNNSKQYQYDAFNRVTRFTDEEGAQTTFVYEGTNAPLPGSNTPVRVIDPHGHTMLYAFDNLYRVIQTTDSAGKSTSLTYDTVGNILSLKDANNNVTTYNYDKINRLITLTNPQGLVTTTTYDKNNNPITTKDFNNQSITFTYNKNNKLTRKSYPDASFVSYTYNANSNMASILDATGTTVYTYDQLNRITKVVAPGVNNTIQYSYDSEGNRTTMTNQDNGVTQYTYDDLSRLISIKNPLNQVTTYAYDTVGNVLNQTNANGTVNTYTYNKRNQVTNIQTKNASNQQIAASSSAYDVGGLLSKVTQENLDVTTYVYDAMHRLINETKKTALGATLYSIAYTYDALGNRLTQNKNGSITTYTYNNLNQLINSTNGAVQSTYQYNNNGNLIAQLEGGQQTQYNYDYDNRLTKITYPDASTSSFAYRFDDFKVRSIESGITTKYLYDGLIPIIERNGNDITQSVYHYGLMNDGGIGSLVSKSENGVSTWYHYIHNGTGNVSHLTNVSGVVVGQYNYEAFGNLSSQSGTIANNRRFQTKELNLKSGLIYFGKRWYNPTIGRWTTPDPLGMVDGPNMYVYLNSDPVNSMDAWGLCDRNGPFMDYLRKNDALLQDYPELFFLLPTILKTPKFLFELFFKPGGLFNRGPTFRIGVGSGPEGKGGNWYFRMSGQWVKDRGWGSEGHVYFFDMGPK